MTADLAKPPLRVALLSFPSVMSDEASLGFAQALGPRLVLLGLSDPMRSQAGGVFGQLRRRIGRSGLGILPYLVLGFGLPGRRGPFRRAAAAAGASFTIVRDVNGPAFHALLRSARPDLIVTLHFDQILSPETIALARFGGINLHPSLLPRHRGPIPTFWALAEGGATGVAVHRLAPRIDAGNLLARESVALPPGISALDAARRLHDAGLSVLGDIVARIETEGMPAGEVLPLLPYCGFPGPADLRDAARRGIRLVRGRDFAAMIPRMLRGRAARRGDGSLR